MENLILREFALFAQRERHVLADGERVEERSVLKNHGDFSVDRIGLRSESVMSWLATMMRPESGLRKPMMLCSETDLPTPLRPRMQTISPGRTSKLTFFSTLSEPKALETFLNSM